MHLFIFYFFSLSFDFLTSTEIGYRLLELLYHFRVEKKMNGLMGFEKVVHLKKLYKVWFAIVIQVVFKVIFKIIFV